MSTGVIDVARKKGVEPTEPSEEGEGSRPIAIAVRGWPVWKAWAGRLREFASKKLGVRLSLNALVALSMANYAKSIGFKEEPPER